MKTLLRQALWTIGIALAAAGCRTPAPAPADASASYAAMADSELSLVSHQGAGIIGQAGASGEGYSYAPGKTIIVGERLTVQVWLKDKATQLAGFPMELEVPESGDFFFPHTGLVHVMGLTAEGLKNELQARYTQFLNDVSVIVLKKGERVTGADKTTQVELGNHFIIMGHINRPGLYSLRPGLRVRDAIALAGDLEHYGHPNIFLIRGSADKPEVVRIDLQDIFLGLDLRKNVQLAANDAIYVAPKQMWKIADFVSLMFMPITNLRDTLWVYDRMSGTQ